MARKKYDEFPAIVRVPRGTKLTDSRKARGWSSPLVHTKGKRGVSGQAIIKRVKKHPTSLTGPHQPSRPAGGRQSSGQSATSWILRFTAKCALVILAVAAVLSLLAVVLGEIADGLTAGLDRLQVLAAESAEIVAVGIGALISLTVVIWVTRLLFSSAGIASQAQRTDAAQYRTTVPAGQPRIYGAEPLAVRTGWYPDPWDVQQLRFWDGSIWTQKVHARGASTRTHAAGWFPDPQGADLLRWWDGSLWTGHVNSNLPSSQQAGSAGVPRVHMTTAEWQAHVEAWAMTGAMHQELWRRLINVQLIDAEPGMLEAQRRFEHLTAEESSHQLRRLTASDAPQPTENLVAEFMDLLLRQSRSIRHGIPLD